MLSSSFFYCFSVGLIDSSEMYREMNRGARGNESTLSSFSSSSSKSSLFSYVLSYFSISLLEDDFFEGAFFFL